MDKEQALHQFWSQFKVDGKSIPAYDQSTVPDDAPFPRITYEVITDNFGVQNVLTASIWDRSKSWQGVTDILHEVEEQLGRGGQTLHCKGGMVWIYRGMPFAQRMPDTDDSIRRIVINIEGEFITEV